MRFSAASPRGPLDRDRPCFELAVDGSVAEILDAVQSLIGAEEELLVGHCG